MTNLPFYALYILRLQLNNKPFKDIWPVFLQTSMNFQTVWDFMAQLSIPQLSIQFYVKLVFTVYFEFML
jgi:hypothetical protein